MGQEIHELKKRVTRTLHLSYLLYLPKSYRASARKKWPLILFLHGAGERGDDVELIKKHGLPKLIDAGQEFPFIIVSPQCPEETWWSSHLDALDALLDETVKTYAADTTRLYLTGLSMGGFGAWHYASLHPRRFAALAPICGGGPWPFGFPDKVAVLKDVPIWVFHGARDRIVPLAESKRLVKVLEKVGGDVRFTVYPNAEHDSWTRTYFNPELYQWFLQHTNHQRG